MSFVSSYSGNWEFAIYLTLLFRMSFVSSYSGNWEFAIDGTPGPAIGDLAALKMTASG